MSVHLVGAGPGDPELLTVRAAALIGRADCIVHDALVGPRVLDLAPPWAELLDVGKRGGRASVGQDEIVRVLLDRGRRPGTVVRLKGGDPFVFGRGGEEALALAAAGIDHEIVPGLSAATAAPAIAGIPVTHRGLASGFTVVTAHQDDDSDPLDWDALAASHTTLVVLMGARRARRLAERLMAAGCPGHTPVAVIVDASGSAQHVARIRLGDLGLEPVPSPATIVIGAVAALDLGGAHLEPPVTLSALEVAP